MHFLHLRRIPNFLEEFRVRAYDLRFCMLVGSGEAPKWKQNGKILRMIFEILNQEKSSQTATDLSQVIPRVSTVLTGLLFKHANERKMNLWLTLRPS